MVLACSAGSSVRVAGPAGSGSQTRALLGRSASVERAAQEGAAHEAPGESARRSVGGNAAEAPGAAAESGLPRRESKKRRGQSGRRDAAVKEVKKMLMPEAVLSQDVGRCPVGRCAMGNLCDEDKSQISKLLQQVLSLSEDSERAGQEIMVSRKMAEDLTEKNAELVEEVCSLRGKLGHALELLRAYQKRMKEMQQALSQSDSALAAARGVWHQRSMGAPPELPAPPSAREMEDSAGPGDQREDLSNAITALEEASAEIRGQAPPSLLPSPLDSPRSPVEHATALSAAQDGRQLAPPPPHLAGPGSAPVQRTPQKAQPVSSEEPCEQTPAPNKRPAPRPHQLPEGSPQAEEPPAPAPAPAPPPRAVAPPPRAAGLLPTGGVPPEALREKAKQVRRERKQELRARVAQALGRWRRAGGLPPDLSAPPSPLHHVVGAGARGDAVQDAPPAVADRAAAHGGEAGGAGEAARGRGAGGDRAPRPELESAAARTAMRHLHHLAAPLTDSEEEGDVSAEESTDDDDSLDAASLAPDTVTAALLARYAASRQASARPAGGTRTSAARGGAPPARRGGAGAFEQRGEAARGQAQGVAAVAEHRPAGRADAGVFAGVRRVVNTSCDASAETELSSSRASREDVVVESGGGEQHSNASTGQSEAARSPGGTQWNRRLGKAPRLEVAGGKCAPAEDEAAEQEEESFLSVAVLPGRRAETSFDDASPVARRAPAEVHHHHLIQHQQLAQSSSAHSRGWGSSRGREREEARECEEDGVSDARESEFAGGSDAGEDSGSGVEALLAAEQREGGGLSAGDSFYDASLLDLVAFLDDAIDTQPPAARAPQRAPRDGVRGRQPAGGRQAPVRGGGEQRGGAGGRAERFWGGRHGEVLDR